MADHELYTWWEGMSEPEQRAWIEGASNHAVVTAAMVSDLPAGKVAPCTMGGWVDPAGSAYWVDGGGPGQQVCERLQSFLIGKTDEWGAAGKL